MRTGGVGISLALDRRVEGAETDSFAGHALHRARWELSEAAEELGLPPLEEFVSLSPEESEILAADLHFDSDVDATTPAGWFPAPDGLRLVRALLERTAEDPDSFPDPEALQAELGQLEALLGAAASAGARFRLAVAY